MIKTDMNTEEKVDIADKLDIAGVAGQADAADTVDTADMANTADTVDTADTMDAELAGLLAEMKTYGEANHVPIINARGLQVLTEAVAKKKPRRVLEIGTAIGYSALYIAANAAADARIITLELSDERADQAEAFIARSRFARQIEVVRGDAGENILKQSGSFDLVFIDAAKGQYPDYFRKVCPLLAEDGVVIADNVLFRGYVQGTEPVPRRFRTIVRRLREYIGMVTENEAFRTEIHADGDGLAVSWRQGR